MTSQPAAPTPRRFTPPTAPASVMPRWMRPATGPVTARQRYEQARRPSDPPWDALPDIARRGWAAAASNATPPATAAESIPDTVWMTYATASRSPDRVCDALGTGQRLCDEFLNELSGEWVVVEEWRNLNMPGAPERWVRYVERDGKVMEQSVLASRVDRVGGWFRPV